ncbi:Helicase IV [Corynebacterium choanae]|uniref:DNA 3'-5' helicase n=2 Tax=Corynebacterium choanae TaxID=1862358 RepID=A0A3G6JFB2_9CORY|nr:Helicase IV [Corynebacterium choanae]
MTTKVIISDQTFTPELRKRIGGWFTMLVRDPQHPSLHIAPLHNSRDPRIRTAPIDLHYRAVLLELRPQPGEVTYVLLAVKNHDDAIDYAKQVHLAPNPVSGHIEPFLTATPGWDNPVDQGWNTDASAGAASQPATSEALTDTDADYPADNFELTPWEILAESGITASLLATELGCSQAVIAALRTSVDEASLLAMIADAPSWQKDAVIGLLAGLTIDEIAAELHVDNSQFATDPTTDRGLVDRLQASNYYCEPDEHTLQAMLEHGSFAAWRLFLHPSQQHAVDCDHSGSARVVGGAGTGKTVVLLHRTNRLLHNPVAAQPPRVLLTSFTRPLAQQLKTQLNELNPHLPEANYPGLPGLAVSGIDATVSSFLRHAPAAEVNRCRSQLFGHSGDYRPTVMNDRTADQLWREAAAVYGADLPATKQHPLFLRAEFTEVLLHTDLNNQQDYLTTARIGRGTQLSKRERAIIFTITQEFLRRCGQLAALPFAAHAVLAAAILEARQEPLLDHIIVDEAQDFHAGHWRFIRAAVQPGPNDIFFAEDSHQRIYGNRLSLARFGIETRGQASHRLRHNYRTTKETLDFAAAILAEETFFDSTGFADTTLGYRSLRHGPHPQMLRAASKTDEQQAIVDKVRHWLSRNEPNTHIGILARTRDQISEIVATLADHGIDCVTKRSGKTPWDGQVSAHTMHHAKGMEFTHVLLADMSEDSMSKLGLYEGCPPAEQNESLQRERALLYVAASRARDELAITVVGEPTSLIPLD